MTLARSRTRFAAVFGVLGVLVLGLTAAVWTRARPQPVAAAADPVALEHLEIVVRVIAGPGWHVTDQYVAPRVLVMNVQTDRTGAVEEIAREIVAKIDEPQDEVLVYFHRTSATAERSFAGAQWTPTSGYRTWKLE